MGVTLRRGFKADAERQASALREAIGTSDRETIPLPRLAAHLKVAVLAGDMVLGSARPFLELHREQPGAFSAVTLHLPDGRIVVAYNPVSFDGKCLSAQQAKRDGRTRSNVAHEFAHIVLGHELREMKSIAGQHFFTCNPEQEAEATWLAGCLLLPRPLLLGAARQKKSDSQLAVAECVSEEMVRFRMNATGVRMQVARGARR